MSKIKKQLLKIVFNYATIYQGENNDNKIAK